MKRKFYNNEHMTKSNDRPHHYVNGETDEYIGYEKTDDWFPQSLAFMVPPRAVHLTYHDEYDHDYPDVLRGIRNLSFNIMSFNFWLDTTS